MIPITGKYSTATVMVGDPNHVVEPDEYKQILSFVNCPVFTNDSKIMPDYHYGKGAVIGFTMPMTDQIIPNIVGVDISCNMFYVSFQKHLDFSRDMWLAVDKQIRKKIPMAQSHHKTPYQDINKFPWAIASLAMDKFASRLNKHLGTEYEKVTYDPDYFFHLCDKVNCKPVTAVNSIGSLGGGNHFIEFNVSEATGHTGVVLHAGSRNLGLKVANYWQKVAKNNIKKKYTVERDKQIRELKCNLPMEKWDAAIKATKLPPVNTGLEYLEGEDMFGYLVDMHFCHYYAYQNLLCMAYIILETLNLPPRLLMSKDNVHTIHNFIDPEDLIIRKGAVRSYAGERMLIPFNMEDGILICEGKSNEEWNFSAPHGAGRLFGRKAMKKRKDINTRDIRDRMNKNGVLVSVLPKDEVKEAYKDPKFIEEAIAPTADIVDRLIPVLPIKADD